MSSSRSDVFRACVLVLAIATSLLLHHHAGLTFPLPWPDESVFLWPAKMLADRGAWTAPQLNGSRPILWMPPGYMVLMAAVLRWAPLSLPMVRWISWLFSAGVLTGIFYLHRRQRSSPYSLAMLGAIAIVPSWVVAGNIARMEALLLCTSVWGFVLLGSGRAWKGLSLLALGPLIHPNGVVFLATGILSVAFTPAWRITRKLSDHVLFGAVILAFVGYSVLVFRYREAFFHDMGYQLARKGDWSVVGALLTRRALVVALGIVGAAVASWLVWGRPRTSLWLILASSAIPVLSGEMWYLVFGDLGILLLIAEWLDIAAAIRLPVLGGVHPTVGRNVHFVRTAFLIAATAAGLRLARWLDVTASPRDLPRNLSWECMKMQPAPYVEESERRVVNDAISRVARTQQAYRVGFDPPSDGLLFEAEHSGDYLPFFPIFSGEKNDLLVVHVTPEWRFCEPEQGTRLQQSVKSRSLLFQYERDSSHRWYVFQASARDGSYGFRCCSCQKAGDGCILGDESYTARTDRFP